MRPLTVSQISDFGDRLVIHYEGTDPTEHQNIVLAVGDAFASEPEAAFKFATGIMEWLNSAKSKQD